VFPSSSTIFAVDGVNQTEFKDPLRILGDPDGQLARIETDGSWQFVGLKPVYFFGIESTPGPQDGVTLFETNGETIVF